MELTFNGSKMLDVLVIDEVSGTYEKGPSKYNNIPLFLSSDIVKFYVEICHVVFWSEFLDFDREIRYVDCR